jgi:geranylgeranyl diphosphate synthase type II
MTAPAPGHQARTPPLIPQVLEEYGALTRKAMQSYLPSGSPRGYFYDLIADYPLRGGKMMRSSLCIATARVFGARIEQAVCTAAAIELLHNALLVHDDIQDDSEERRGRPTLHAQHGLPLALNAGDALCLLSMRPLMDNALLIGPRHAARIFEEADRMAWESAEGQAMELGWCRDNCNGLTDEDYLVMVLKKTCWLAIIFPSRAGAIIGAHDGIDLDQFIRFGFFLGASFQIQDDLLNFVADSRYGKELHGDIWEGKRTLMLNHVYRQATPEERGRIAEILALPRSRRNALQVNWIRRLMDTYGSVEYASKIAHGLAGAALHEFHSIYGHLPDSRDKRFIEGLSTWVFERT